jgi:hypothetical protein
MKFLSKKSLSIGLAIGLGLIVLSYLWPTIRPVASQWTEVEQKKLDKVGSEMHALQYKAAHARRDKNPNVDRLEGELRHWKMEYEKESKHLASIRSQSNVIVNILYYTGIALTVASCGALVYLRDEQEKESVTK